MARLHNFLVHAVFAAASLYDSPQNGNSYWGTLDAFYLPAYLLNSPSVNGTPWGSRDIYDPAANYGGPTIPNTGVTRYYNFTIARATIAPDGVTRDSILINGQFPGPLIDANWGDWIEVTVNNRITNPMEGTSLHWHGMLQQDTQWMDGVPGISQCPIAPGASFTYRFQAHVYGTSWYHSHYSAQYTGGASGPFVVYGPSSMTYDLDVGPVMLSDWYHEPYFQTVENVVGTDISKLPPTSDSNLVNGKNSFNCSSITNTTTPCAPNAALSRFIFQPGMSHRLRLMNTGADGVQKFSIDGHSMTIIAQDYVPVQPYNVDVVSLGVAQRTDVVVKALDSWPQAAYWMRSSLAQDSACGPSKNPHALAIVYYDTMDLNVIPTTTSTVNDTTCMNEDISLAIPEAAIVPAEATYTEHLIITLTVNATGHPLWELNGQTFRANFNFPLLFLAGKGNLSYPWDPQWNAYNYAQNTSIRFYVENQTPFAHPFHAHGHNMYLLSVGNGTWDGVSVMNPSNPTRRDVHIVPALGHMVMQIEADNPGVWPFHCHVAWHLSGGLAMNIISRPDQIGNIPDVMPQTCTDWDAYSNANVVEQIDAGD